MFKVGDFSKLTDVSVKTLHHYDDIGLFKPMQVDPFTGYRYYSFDQLPRLNRILALKDLGFPLEQIAQIIDDELNAEQIEGMLRLRQAELESQVKAGQERLARVSARLEQIKQEGKMPDQEVILKQVESVKIASAREVVASPEKMRERCQALVDEVCKLFDQGVKTDGVCLAIYHNNGVDGIDVEMAFYVDSTTPLDKKQGRAGIRELPGTKTMASIVYRGSYDAFDKVGQTHVALGKWIESNGYRVVGANREIYLQTPQSAGGDGVMEIQFPVEKA